MEYIRTATVSNKNLSDVGFTLFIKSIDFHTFHPIRKKMVYFSLREKLKKREWWQLFDKASFFFANAGSYKKFLVRIFFLILLKKSVMRNGHFWRCCTIGVI